MHGRYRRNLTPPRPPPPVGANTVYRMALIDYSPAPDDARPVLAWWACLSSVAAFNVAVLLRSARSTHSSNRRRLPPWLRSLRDGQCAASTAYVLGCAYRSVLPCHHTLRRALVRSVASTGFAGRSVATLAELGVAAQASLLLREIGTATGRGAATSASRAIVPAVAIAELSSWHACATSNYAGSVLEEGLWAACALLVAICLAGCMREYEAGGEQRIFVRRAVREKKGHDGRASSAVFCDACPVVAAAASLLPLLVRRRPDACPRRPRSISHPPRIFFIFSPVASRNNLQLILSVVYFAYMVCVDVPNYVRAHLADAARGATYRPPRDGLRSLQNIDEHDLTWRYDDWRYSMVWMTLYFSVACWASIWMVNAPRMDEGLVARRSGSLSAAAAAAAASRSTTKKAM